jgi:DNA topoisomerase
MQKHRYRTGRNILYCSNEACSSRIGSPIEKELARQKERAQAAKKAPAAPPAAKKKSTRRKGTHA